MTELHQRLDAVQEAVRGHRKELLACLLTVETHATATTELRWLLAGLAPPTQVVGWMRGRRPIGSVYVATPATLPLYSFLLFALAPALVGNRVVVRPASVSRTCVDLLAAITSNAGVPVVTSHAPWSGFAGDAADQADGVVFCGGTPHARALDERLPDRIRLICQGPGVCAMVVTPDADLTAAARTAVTTRVFNSSQDCLATERIYIAEEVFEAFVGEMLAVADGIRVGDNTDPATDVGPLLLGSAATPWMGDLAAHGTVLRPAHQHGRDHYGLAVVEAAADAPIVLEETYCPVLPVVGYRDHRDLRDMLALGEYALGVTIFGTPPPWGALDFGHVAIDDSLYAFEDAWSPFGGHRATTLTRHRDHRRTGPVLVPLAMTDPA